MAGKPRQHREGSNAGSRPAWSWHRPADMDIELKPVGAGGGLLNLPTPDAAARCAYRLLLHHGGEDLLLGLQQQLCRLARAVSLRRLTAARS